ncbi:MAG TPA: prenyltransferase/squalene oxidase repeat-containing protein [Humisphaera sp.]
MSLRLEMLQVARLAPKLLGDSADLVANFLRSTQTPEGGFADRGGRADLYYSVFAIEGLFALRADLPLAGLRRFLESFGGGDGGDAPQDFVHLCCLSRCWAMFRDAPPAADVVTAILGRIEACRAPDGGYGAKPGDAGTIYHSFLALGAYQDLGRAMPDERRILDCVRALRMPDGGYANQPDIPVGITPPTAAAVTLLRHFNEPPDAAAGDWLMARHFKQGGFFATPDAPIPDLLSTATALHALAGMKRDIDPIREPCLDFVDTLWTTNGGFLGSWEDEVLDAEYSYYGLLALGHLAV